MAGSGAGLSAGLQCELDSQATRSPSSPSLSLFLLPALPKSVTLSRHLLVYQRDGEHGFGGPAGDEEVREDCVGPCARALVWDRVGMRVKCWGFPCQGVGDCVCLQPVPILSSASLQVSLLLPLSPSPSILCGVGRVGDEGARQRVQGSQKYEGMRPSLL